VSWIDIDNEHPVAGRYLIEVNDNDTTITPASPTVIARELHRRAALDHI